MIEAASLTTRPSISRVRSRPARPRRKQTDERLVALVREGDDRAFELLVNRYQPRLLAYCRRMVGSPQDAEDVLQEVFAAAHTGILAHNRPINAGPWLYRIARNRSVNHLRRRGPATAGVESMDVHPHENGTSTLERVQQREELQAIVADVRELPKTQRTALVLRQIDDLSYTDIAQTMGKSLPSVKSLLIRARMSLAESSAGRAALAPFALLALLRKLIPAKLGGGSAAGGTAGVAASAGSTGGAAGTAGGVAGAAATGLGGALGAKAAVGIATAVLVTAGAVSVDGRNPDNQPATATAGGARVSAAAGATTDETRRSATSSLAGRSARADAAGAPGARARTSSTGPRGRGGSATAKPPVGPASPLKPPAGLGPTQKPAAVGRQLPQAASSIAESLRPPVASQAAAAAERARAVLRPVTHRVLPPRGPRLGSLIGR